MGSKAILSVVDGFTRPRLTFRLIRQDLRILFPGPVRSWELQELTGDLPAATMSLPEVHSRIPAPENGNQKPSAGTSMPPPSRSQRLVLASQPPWSRMEGKFQVDLPQIPLLRGGICTEVDFRNPIHLPLGCFQGGSRKREPETRGGDLPAATISLPEAHARTPYFVRQDIQSTKLWQ